jgi:hypothetical protein
MDLTTFVQKLAKYEARAAARRDERLSTGHLDGTYRDHVHEEMLMDIIDRLEHLEGILTPTE